MKSAYYHTKISSHQNVITEKKNSSEKLAESKYTEQ